MVPKPSKERRGSYIDRDGRGKKKKVGKRWLLRSRGMREVLTSSRDGRGPQSRREGRGP